MVEAMDVAHFILGTRSPKGGGGKGGGGSSGGSSSKSTKNKSSGPSRSFFAPCIGCGGLWGLPVWLKVIILISIIMSSLFVLAFMYYSLKERARVKSGAVKKFRGHKVIWSSFKVATFLGIFTWFYHACTGRKSKSGGAYNKIEEGQQLQNHPPAPSPSHWMNVQGQSVEAKYEPMSYPTYYHGAASVATAPAPATSSMAPTLLPKPYPVSTTPAPPPPYVQPLPAQAPPQTVSPVQGAAAEYYMPTPPGQTASPYAPPPTTAYAQPTGYMPPYNPPPH